MSQIENKKEILKRQIEILELKKASLDEQIDYLKEKIERLNLV